jgi:hypothetical protein
MIKHPDGIWSSGADTQGNAFISETPATAVLKARKADGTATTLFTYDETSDTITAAKPVFAIIKTYPVYDPRRYGAAGDDATVDVTTAVQMAIDSGNTLFLPPNLKFGITHVTIAGHGYYSGSPGFRVHGGGWLRQVNGSTQTMMSIDYVDDFQMFGVTLHGNKTGQTVANYGIRATNSSFGKISSCLITSFSGTNVLIAANPDVADEWNLVNNEIIFSGGFGVYLQDCGDLSLLANHINFNAASGLVLLRCYTSTAAANHILTNHESGTLITDSRSIVMTGNMIRENDRHGMALSGGPGGHVLSGNVVRWNSTSSQGGYDGINADAVPSLQILGNASNDFYALSFPYAPVNGRYNQRYGLYANNCPDIITDGANRMSPNYTGSVNLTGTSAFVAGV